VKIKSKLAIYATEKRATISKRFFKTAKGEYGYGDIFIGVRVPDIRLVAKDNIGLPLKQCDKLIKSKIHEERLLGLIILTLKFRKSSSEDQTIIYNLYCSLFSKINSWDLVDVTCPHIIGKYLIDRDRSVLELWAKSDHLWTRRIAMVTNWWFIRKGDLSSVFKIAKILLYDEHDLIHKAVGWMLREAAKKDLERTCKFLNRHYKKMPRTMLRYAIERFDEKLRQSYLKGTI